MFISFQQFRLRGRLFAVVVGLLVFAYLALAVLLYFDQIQRLTKQNQSIMQQHNVDVHLLLDMYMTERYKQVQNAAQIFKKTIDKKGSIITKDNLLSLRVTNEQTQAVVPISVPIWMLDKNRIHQTFDLLDSLSKATDCYLSIFQKIPQGMLRINTSLKTALEDRMVSIYLPNDWVMVEAVNSGQSYTGRVLLNKKWYIVAYKPLKEKDNVIGMVAAALPERDFSYLTNRLKNKKYLNAGHLYFFSPEGSVILHRDSVVQKMELSKTSPELLKVAQKQKKGHFRYYIPSLKQWRWQYFSHYAKADFYTAIVVSEKDFLDKPLAELRNLLVGSFIIFLAIIAVVVYLFSNTFTRPFAIISKSLARLANGKTTRFINYDRKDEIGSISNSVNQLIRSSEHYAQFAKAIGEERFDEPFEPLSTEDILGNALLHMRDNLKEATAMEKIRNWVVAQNAHFAEVIRKYQDNRVDLVHQVLENLMMRLNMVQGAFYYVEKKGEEASLVLLGAYAYQRKKLIEKRHNTKDGVLGQAYRSKKMIEIKDLPEGYLKLLSGVGEGAPSYLLIIPCQTNTEVLGILELANFTPLESFKISFLQELSNTIGSTLSNIRTAELTVQYLHEAQDAAEALRQQDEELRQNMEELSAAHEQSQQQEKEIRKLLKRSAAREEIMYDNIEELKKYQLALQSQKTEIEKMRAEEQQKYEGMLQQHDAHLKEKAEEFEKRERELLLRINQLENILKKS